MFSQVDNLRAKKKQERGEKGTTNSAPKALGKLRSTIVAVLIEKPFFSKKPTFENGIHVKAAFLKL